MKNWVVYLLRCSDGSLYCGITNDLKKRLETHNLGKGSRYTRSRRPAELVGASFKMTRSDALKLEYRVKKLPTDRKLLALKLETQGGRTDLREIAKALQSIRKNIQRIMELVDRRITKKGN